MSSEPEWTHDDGSISDDERLIRRVPERLYAEATVLDPTTGLKSVSPAMLRYDYAEDVGETQEGLSVHFCDALIARDRDPATAYQPPDATISFLVRDVRGATPAGGVIRQPDPDEPDEVLSEAHGLVRLSEQLEKPHKKHPMWNQFRSALSESASWLTA